MEFVFWTSLLVVFYAYAGYPLVLLGLDRFVVNRRREPRPDPHPWPPVTLIVSAYNEEKVLFRKIENTLAQDYPRDQLEVLVVSDASTDATDDIARRFEAQGVRLIRQPDRRGKTAALNIAVPQATGEIVVFSDANAMYIPSALKNMVRHFTDPRIGYVSGRTVYLRKEGSRMVAATNLYTRLETFAKGIESRVAACVGADGAIFAIRKALFRPLHETDINDFVIPLRIVGRGYRGLLEPWAVCLEMAARDGSSAYQRQVRITNRTLRAIWRNRSVLNPARFPWFAFCLISHKVMKFVSAWAMLLALAACIRLSLDHIVYQLLLAGQAVFYGMAFFSHYYPGLRKNSLVGILYTFCMTQLAMIGGWITFLRGRTYATWAPTTSA